MARKRGLKEISKLPENAGIPTSKLERPKKKTKPLEKVTPPPPFPTEYVPRLVDKTVRTAITALMRDLERFQEIRAKKAEDQNKNLANFINPDQFIFLAVTFKFPPRKGKLRPVAIRLKHPLFKEGEDDICLFVKDPQRLVKDYLAKHGSGGVTRVMGVDKLRKRYGTHEGRRELFKMYDLFLTDGRVAAMMPGLLGKKFIESKKLPCKVNMSRDVVANIKRTIASTQYCPRQGTSTTVRVAKSEFTEEQIYENLKMVVEGVVRKTHGGWDNVQSLAVKTNSSPALELYVSLPEAKRVEKEEKESSSGSESESS